MSYSKLLANSCAMSFFGICAVAMFAGLFVPNESLADDGRIIVQFGGFGAPSFEIASMGIGATPEVPAGVCGFRLETPDGWDEGWHFAGTSPGDVLEGYSNEDWPEPAFIQMTGPISPGCTDDLYLFHTPVAGIIGQGAPAGAWYFIADFLDDDDLVWLDGAGEAILMPEPPEPPPPPIPPPCEFLSDDCGIGGPNTIAPILSCESDPFQPHCEQPFSPPYGIAIGMLTTIVDYGAVAEYFVERAKRAGVVGRGRLLGVPLRLLSVLEAADDDFGSTLRRFERGVQRHATLYTTRKVLRAAGAHAGRARIEIGACLGALQRASYNAANARSALKHAKERCASMRTAATDAREAIMRLQAHAMPAELEVLRRR